MACGRHGEGERCALARGRGDRSHIDISHRVRVFARHARAQRRRHYHHGLVGGTASSEVFRGVRGREGRVIASSRHLAGEFGGSGIRVNCIAPSAVENDRMRSWVSEEQRIALGASFPLGRIGQPENVAAATLFLASDTSSWITGVTLDVAGGKIML